MSDFDFIAWSLLVAGALAALGFIIGRIGKHFRWSEQMSDTRGRRLQRRLDRRMARGDDNYFEELRSIELAIAQHHAISATPTQRFGPIQAIPMIAFALLFGLVLTNWLVHPVLGVAAPKWSDHWAPAWMPITGTQYILDSFQPGTENPWAKRGMGMAFLAIGGLIVFDIARHWP